MAILRDSMAKLDLPGTGEDFARLRGAAGQGGGAVGVGVEKPRPFRFRASGQQTVSAAFTAAVTFGKPPVGYYWLVERLVVKGGGVGSTATVYVGAVADASIVDQTDSANLDVADESSPIYVGSSDELQVRLTAGTAGNIFTVTMQAQAIPV